ncbi:hypothetical protein CEQ90_10135 [Lewinellaceae bacterium SD302]|nr:hypothetical protein CEQ90_10135 [Lewinellaceae bacterium SD302]
MKRPLPAALRAKGMNRLQNVGRSISALLLWSLLLTTTGLSAQCPSSGGPFCYDQTSALIPVAVDICPDPGMAIQVTITAGQVEDIFDEFQVFYGPVGSGSGGTQIYDDYGTGGDLTGLQFTSPVPGECISLYVNSDISVTCASNGFTPISYTTACVMTDCQRIETACYGNIQSAAVLTEICPDAGATMLDIEFLTGDIETSFDDLDIYSGPTGSAASGTQLANDLEGDLTGLTFASVNANDCIILVISSDGSVSCQTSTSLDEMVICVNSLTPACAIDNVVIDNPRCGNDANDFNTDEAIVDVTFDVVGGSGNYNTLIEPDGDPNTYFGGIQGGLATDGTVTISALVNPAITAPGTNVQITVIDQDNQVCQAGPFNYTVHSCPECPPVGDLVITEIMQNPSAVADGSGEWIELYNAGDEVVNLIGFILSDNGIDEHVINQNVLVQPGEYVVLGNNDDMATNGGVMVDYEYSDFFLSNGDDEVIISCPSAEIDRVEYDGGTDFPDPNGASMQLSSDNLGDDNNDGANWCASVAAYGDGDLGTPGAANESCCAIGDTQDPVIVEGPGLDCGDVFTAQSQLDYVLTVEGNPTNGVSGNQDCKSMIILRTPQFQDNCGIDSLRVSFTQGSAAPPQDFEDDFSLSVSNGDFPAGAMDTNFILPSLSFFSFEGGLSATTQVNFEIFDAAGNSTSCFYLITVEDNQAPVLTCQADTIVDLDENGMASVDFAGLVTSATDNCGAGNIDTVAMNLDFTCGDIGTFVVEDAVVIFDGVNNTASANSDTCDITVTVRDTVSPVLVCQDATIDLDANGVADFGFTFVTNNVIVSSTDNCNVNGIGLTVIPGELDCDDIGTFELGVNIQDDAPNFDNCTVTITVADPFMVCNTPPVAVCRDFTVFADENCLAGVVADSLDGGSTDIDGDMLTFTIDPAGPFTLGDTIVDLIVSDGMLSDTCQSTITVLDTIPPMLVVPNDTVVFVSADSCSTVVNYPDIMASDNCDLTITPSNLTTLFAENNGFAGNMFDLENVSADPILITSFEVNVESAVGEMLDLQVWTTPGTFNGVQNDASQWTSLGSATVAGKGVDNPTPLPVGGLTILPGESFGITVYLNNYANSGVTRRFVYTNGDNIYNNGDLELRTGVGLNTPDPFTDGFINSRTWNGSVLYSQLMAEPTMVTQLSGLMSGEEFPLGVTTNVFEAEDASGNTTVDSFTVTVLDTIPPTVICSDTTIFLDDMGMASVEAMLLIEASDNCSLDTLSDFDIVFDCDSVTAPGTTLNFTLIAADSSGNVSSCVASITVLDTVAPVITTTDQTITLNGQGLAQLDIDDIASATDACGIAALFADRELIFDCEDIGDNELLITAIDVNGNEATATVNVTVLFEEPELGCITEINVTLDENCQEELTPQMVLAGNTICLEQFAFDIVVEDNDPSNGPIIDGCGQFTYTIAPAANPGPDEMVLENFEGCWGFVNAEDKTSPVDTMLPTPSAELFCEDISLVNINELPANVSRCWTQSGTSAATLNGSMNPLLRARLIAGGNGTTYVDADGNTIPNGIPNFFDGCSSVEICVNDLVSGTNGDCEDVVITRVFTATDGDCPSVSGEENAPTVVSYQITFTRPSISDVSGVDSIASFSCDANPPLLPPNGFGDANPAPVASDYPFFTLDDGTQVFLDEDGLCNLGATFQDGPRIVTCDQTYKFVRTFTVIDWCQVDSIATYTQLVKVGDFDAPTIVAPTQDLDFNGVPDVGPLFFSTNTADCEAIFAIPAGTASDNCDPNPGITAVIYPNGDTLSLGFGPYNVGELTLTINGGIPAGLHLIRYTSVDDCGNFSQIDVELLIGDQTAPVAICEDGLNVSIGGPIGTTGGIAQICAEDVNAASYDDCSDIELAIRLTEVNDVPLSPFDPLNQFQACHTLSCDQLGTVEIELRVTDDANNDGNFDPLVDNSNFCWLDILVEDKTAPICIPPAPQTIACNELASDFPQDLNVEFAIDPVGTAALLDAQFGLATGLDNCPDPVVTQTVVDGRNSCGVGLITRTFTVTDAQGFTAPPGCVQTINVIGLHDYTVVFPGDQESDQCVEPDYNGVSYTENGCDLITVSASIDTFTATADECYKLRISYEVLNWCEYNTIDEAYAIPRDADGDGILDMDTTVLHVIPNQDGLADDVAFLDRDVNRFNFNAIGNLDTGDGGILAGSDVEGYGLDGSRGAFTYVQFIKVYDDTPPTLVVTDSTDFCSFDGVNCDADVSLNFSIDDECSPASVNATVELDAFINPGADGIYTLADFVADGGNVTDAITNNGDGTFTINLPDIPIGRHALRIRATDGCGNTAIELLEFEVADCKAPTPICINGLTVTLMPDGDGGGMAAIWVSDFIASPSEDCSGPVKFAIYLDDEVSGDPNFIPNVIDTGLVLSCDELGPQTIRIYAIDGMGQSDYCQTSLLVQAFNPTVCGPGPGPDASLSGAIMTPIDEMLNGVQVDITSNAGMTDAMFTAGGLYSFTELTTGDDYTVQPTHNPSIDLGRVTTADLIAISRHILGLQQITDTYQLLAADVTQEATINILDIIAIRRVILGLDAEFSSTNSWRFYATDELLENWTENNLEGNLVAPDFIAVEMGNVNQTALSLSGSPAHGGESEGRGGETIITEDIVWRAGEVSTITIGANGAGFQGTFEVAPGVEIVDVVAADANATAFNLTEAASGLIAFSHTGGEGFELTLRATTDTRLSEVLSLTDRITPTEAYPVAGGVADLGLSFVSAATAGSELFQNSPNPFGTQTQIAFNLEVAGTATLLVQNQNGQLLRSYEIDAAAGLNTQTITRQELGNASGVLTYTIVAEGFTATRKMILQ